MKHTEDSVGKKSAGPEDFRSPWQALWITFRKDCIALAGVSGIVFLFLVAVYAPLLANGKPLLFFSGGKISFPMLYYVFAPDSTEIIVAKVFNYLMVLLPPVLLMYILLFRRHPRGFRVAALFLAAVLLVPFLTMGTKLDRTDWRELASEKGNSAVFAPIRYGPNETAGSSYLRPSAEHILGTDHIGRDVLSRMIYGTRVSLAVGVFATSIAIVLGIIIGMAAGYFRGRTDLVIMRIVEIVICFPTFLLLLILMAILMDSGFTQSILLIIAVIGFTGWTGLSRIVRGEVLKQRALPYILSCECLGVPVWRIMFFHLLPNVLGPILVAYTFGIAGAIIAESGLSFLGFGVQAPTASWGGLLRQAFKNPFLHWHLTLWPGLALLVAVLSFNFAGEGLRRTLDPRSR